VKTLPNTGAGGGTSDASLTMLILAIAAVMGASVLTWRRRRMS
jgi:LPXTG-motif cell wall-anchored protein